MYFLPEQSWEVAFKCAEILLEGGEAHAISCNGISWHRAIVKIPDILQLFDKCTKAREVFKDPLTDDGKVG